MATVSVASARPTVIFTLCTSPTAPVSSTPPSEVDYTRNGQRLQT